MQHVWTHSKPKADNLHPSRCWTNLRLTSSHFPGLKNWVPLGVRNSLWNYYLANWDLFSTLANVFAKCSGAKIDLGMERQTPANSGEPGFRPPFSGSNQWIHIVLIWSIYLWFISLCISDKRTDPSAGTEIASRPRCGCQAGLGQRVFQSVLVSTWDILCRNSTRWPCWNNHDVQPKQRWELWTQDNPSTHFGHCRCPCHKLFELECSTAHLLMLPLSISSIKLTELSCYQERPCRSTDWVEHQPVVSFFHSNMMTFFRHPEMFRAVKQWSTRTPNRRTC